VMIIVHEKPRAAIPVAEAERLIGYNACADCEWEYVYSTGEFTYIATPTRGRFDYGIKRSRLTTNLSPLVD
jgi:hypothetical protein